MGCNWPEISRYCGLCSLRTGIYVKSILNVVMGVVTLVTNVILITNFMSLGRALYSSCAPTINEYFPNNLTGHDTQAQVGLRRTVFVLSIMWVVFKSGYVIVALCTIWAVYMRKAVVLKILMYLCIPIWVFDLLTSLVAGILAPVWLRIIMHVSIFSEVYNILAIRSEYKTMIGKPALECVESEVASPYYRPPGDPICMEQRTEHCRTCTCFAAPEVTPQTTQPRPQNRPIMNTPSPTYEAPPTYEDKQLNIKDEPIIFNQNQLAMGRNSIIYYVGVNEPNSSTTPSTSREKDDEKVDISETPVIYDESQLNMGSNAVIKDTDETLT